MKLLLGLLALLALSLISCASPDYAKPAPKKAPAPGLDKGGGDKPPN